MSKELLEQVSKMAKAQDAAGLVGLQDHDDKAVRKAARKAIHGLRSKGVEIPDGPGRAWHAQDTNQSLRAALEEGAVVDVFGIPGVTRFFWARPGDERGGMLVIGAVAPNGAYVECDVFGQSDGQRNKMFRDWGDQYGSHRLPVDWVRSRLAWAREATIKAGYTPPPAADELLPELGEVPTERPASFLPAKLESVTASDGPMLDLLMQVGAARWPVLFDADKLFKALEESSKGLDEGADQATRLAEMRRLGSDDEAFAEGLRGPFADLFDDVAVGLWQAGREGDAKRLVDAAASFRSADKPGDSDDAAGLLWAQVVGVVFRQGGRAGAPQAG